MLYSNLLYSFTVLCLLMLVKAFGPQSDFSTRELAMKTLDMLPDELIPVLYENYRLAAENDDVISERRFFTNNKQFQVHIEKLKQVNGVKRHNLMIKSLRTDDDNPIVYINNPVESKLPNAFLTINEFKKMLTDRVVKLNQVYKSTKKVKTTFATTMFVYRQSGSTKSIATSKPIIKSKPISSSTTSITSFEQTKKIQVKSSSSTTSPRTTNTISNPNNTKSKQIDRTLNTKNEEGHTQSNKLEYKSTASTKEFEKDLIIMEKDYDKVQNTNETILKTNIIQPKEATTEVTNINVINNSGLHEYAKDIVLKFEDSRNDSTDFVTENTVDTQPSTPERESNIRSAPTDTTFSSNYTALFDLGNMESSTDSVTSGKLSTQSEIGELSRAKDSNPTSSVMETETTDNLKSTSTSRVTPEQRTEKVFSKTHSTEKTTTKTKRTRLSRPLVFMGS